MTKTFREKRDINIVQQTSCELFSRCSNAVKNVVLCSFWTSMLHRSYGVTSWRHTCRGCVWPIYLVAELYTTFRGERVLLVVRFNVTFLRLRPYSEKMCTSFLERCRKSNNLWLRALMQSDCSYSSLSFERYNYILLCDWVLGRCSVSLMACAYRPQHIHTLPSLNQGWAQCPTLGVVFHQVLRVSEQSVKKVSVTLCFYRQCRCKTFCCVCFVNLRCADSECLCSMDFVSASKP